MPVARIEIEQTAERWCGSVEAGGPSSSGRRTTHFVARSAEEAIARAAAVYRDIVGVAPAMTDAAHQKLGVKR